MLPLTAVREVSYIIITLKIRTVNTVRYINHIFQRVAEALNLSHSTVSSISQKVKNNIALSSPKQGNRSKKVTNTVQLDTSAIRNTIYAMYEHSK